MEIFVRFGLCMLFLPVVVAGREPGPVTRVWSQGRVVAIGDVHGDMAAVRKALQRAELVDDEGRWIGAHTVAVQVGDQLDRGDDEREILDWFEALAVEARQAGGAFYALIGNHEQMNALLDFRYVTPGGFEDFQDVDYDPADPVMQGLPAEYRGRAAAFQPGGPYALRLANHPVALIVDDTLFVHGGVLPIHVAEGLDALNAEHSAWLRGRGALSSTWQSADSPLWDRTFSRQITPEACALLEETLQALDLKRMVVAHTVQENGVSPACGGRVIRVDVGLAAHYGGPVQTLELLGGQPSIIY